MSEVFVSYKRENLAAVGRLVEALRAEGVDVWWDRDIPPNAAWEAYIETALAAAKLVVVAWSPAAVASENVKAEARWARQQGRLLQVFVEDCEPPLFFGERQGVNLTRWSGGATDAAFTAVLAAVGERLAPATTSTSEPSGTPEPPLPLPTKPSIAVLPFVNLSGDPEQDYFADGMVEEIARALSLFKSLFVIGGGSSLSFKGKAIAPREAGRMLGVRYLLEGSVRRAAGRVRIAVKLIDAADGAQIWTDRFDDTLEDVFALQDKVALAVAGVIGPAVLEAEIRRATARPAEDVGSYDLYLRARSLMRSMAKADMLAALDLFNRALALDPGHGSALATTAYCHALIIAFGWFDEAESHFSAALSLTRRAIKAANDDPDVFAAVAGVTLMLGGDVESAAALADRAMMLNPGSPLVWGCGGLVGLYRGQPEVTFEYFGTVLRLDPLSPDRAQSIGMQGMARFAQRRFAEAVPLLRQSAQLLPEWGLPPAVLAASHGHLGETNAARAAMARFGALSSVSMRDWAAAFTEPDLQKLLLEGMALAQGVRPPEPSAGQTADE